MTIEYIEVPKSKMCECGHGFNTHLERPYDQRSKGGQGKTTWKRHCAGIVSYTTKEGEKPCRCKGFHLQKETTGMTTTDTNGNSRRKSASSAAKPSAATAARGAKRGAAKKVALARATASTRTARSRSRRESSTITPPKAPATLLSASELLAQIVETRANLHEELAATREAERLVTEELAREVLDSEPWNEDGTSPVIAFNKKFGGSDREYAYAAIGIEVNVHNSEDVAQVWCLTNGDASRAKGAMTWPELVKFMGTSGLSSMEVLR